MLDRILAGCAALAGVILALIVLGICANVALRNLAGAPIHGLLDLVEYGLLLVTFLGAPWVLSQGAHVTVDLLTGALTGAPARLLARAMAVLGCAVCLLLVWYAWTAAATSFARGSMIRTAFDTPEWIVLSVAPVSFALMAIEFARQAVHPPVRADTHTGL